MQCNLEYIHSQVCLPGTLVLCTSLTIFCNIHSIIDDCNAASGASSVSVPLTIQVPVVKSEPRKSPPNSLATPSVSSGVNHVISESTEIGDELEYVHQPQESAKVAISVALQPSDQWNDALLKPDPMSPRGSNRKKYVPSDHMVRQKSREKMVKHKTQQSIQSTLIETNQTRFPSTPSFVASNSNPNEKPERNLSMDSSNATGH